MIHLKKTEIGFRWRYLFAWFVFMPAPIFAQVTVEDEEIQEYARPSKEIALQNESEWEDNRWQKTDVGPFLAGSILSQDDHTLKGIAIRVGEEGQATVCFDTARMRISSAWTGGFLKFGARRFGLIEFPEADGELFFTTKKMAGWAFQGRFEPEAGEITHPDVSEWYEQGIETETRLPRNWAHYRGHYANGNRIILSYSVGETSVLESPWYVNADDQGAFVRSLEIGPSDGTLEMVVAGQEAQFSIIGRADVSVKDVNETAILVIAPHEKTIRVKLLITRKDANAISINRLRETAGQPEDLSQMIKHDPGRFPDVLLTKGQTTEVTESSEPYVIDTLTLPFENPWKALFFTAGHDFYSNGTAAVCTVHGDVWTLSGIDRDLQSLKWRRFATGLHQPLGLKILDDKVYVIGRNQITRLHDRNDDGEADYYENFNNDIIISPRAHDYVTCLDTDQEGNFYFIHARTGVMKLAADGSTLASIASGFRNPNGMGVAPDGTISAAPQQGNWTPESSLIIVEKGGYYGFGGPKITKDRPTGWDLPMCFIPRSMDNSGGGQVWVEGDRWGPLSGKMLHLSYGQCRMLLALTEQVDGQFQGGTIQFPTTPGDFESGIMRGRFNSRDGQLYVSGLRGWQTRSIRDGCLQRVRYTGRPVHLPVKVETYSNGIKLTYTERLEKDFAENPENYFVEQWNYKFSKDYGSPDFSVRNPDQQGRDEVSVRSATLMEDGYAIFLELPGRQVVNQINISWLLKSASGEQFRGSFAHTINRQPQTTISEEEIVRREMSRTISVDLEKRLKSGLEFEFESSAAGQTDRRVGRLVALNQAISASPTPFLPAGPFQLTISGTVKTPLSGFFDFKIDGSHQVQVWINDIPVLKAEENQITAEPVLLQKGHNRIRIRYASPRDGNAKLLLCWKGHDFGWEPVPPNVLFHDGGSRELRVAQRRRLGREWFADYRCVACHQTGVENQEMFELALKAPDLSNAGDRFDVNWLQKWLLSPRLIRPYAHMPAVLGNGHQAEQDAADLAAFLVSQQENARDVRVPVEDWNRPLENGERLFEELGCLSCHHFGRPDVNDGFDRLSLYYVGQKYRDGALLEFLKKPAAHFAAIQMPDFRLDDGEAGALTAFVRSKSTGEIAASSVIGNLERGRNLLSDKGCLQCHGVNGDLPVKQPYLPLDESGGKGGCLMEERASKSPVFAFTKEQRESLQEFLLHDRESLQRNDIVETSRRLFEKLQCANCHDRDGQRSQRMLTLIEDGSGGIPESLPELTWSGEKLKPDWTLSMLTGRLPYRSRPWLKSRMPSFPAYAEVVAHGFAAEHGVDPAEEPVFTIEPELAQIGEKLSLQTGLDCRQCHGVGDSKPLGDKDTTIAPGINFSRIRERMRRDAYQRFMLDPPRFDMKTKMIRLSEDGRTTKLRSVFEADANKQFDAIWHYIQSLKD